MAAFFTEGEAFGVLVIFVEVGAPLDEFFDGLGAFFDDDFDGVFVAESCAGIEGVCDMFLAGVVWVSEFGWEDGRDSSLSPGGI